MNRDEVIEALKKEIETLSGKPLQDIDQKIFESGYLDSLNLLHMITFIESKFSIPIEPFDVNIDTFGTISDMANYVLRDR